MNKKKILGTKWKFLISMTKVSNKSKLDLKNIRTMFQF